MGEEPTVPPDPDAPRELPAVTAEFTIEPFIPGQPGPHVQAAVDACVQEGLDVEVEPFGTRIGGDDDQVAAAVGELTRAALRAGATRVSLQVNRRLT